MRTWRGGEEITAARLNQMVRAELERVVGGDGIQISRAGGQMIINLSRRDRPAWTTGAGGGSSSGSTVTLGGAYLTGDPIEIDSYTTIMSASLGAGIYQVHFDCDVYGGTSGDQITIDIYNGTSVLSNANGWLGGSGRYVHLHCCATFTLTGTTTIYFRANHYHEMGDDAYAYPGSGVHYNYVKVAT